MKKQLLIFNQTQYKGQLGLYCIKTKIANHDKKFK